MASRDGPRPVGSDGFDFNHRQKVAFHYQISAKNKSRLKFCIFVHCLLFLLMSAKLLQDVLDRMNIFILEIEELEIPKPDRWEWLWQSSIIFNLFGLSAVRRNRLGSMQFYIFGIVTFAVCPLLYAAVYYFGEMWQFIDSRNMEGIIVWQGYPVAVIWYIFILAALQVHSFSLYFATQLLLAWKTRGGTKKIQ